MSATEHVIVDVQRFKEAIWAVERENFWPGDALDALELAIVLPTTPTHEAPNAA